ncbi:MAG: DNA-processing protein DprA [Patescibacteria group bacterium]
MDIKTESYVAFSHFLGIGPIKIQAVKKYFGSIENAYKAPVSDLSKVLRIKLAQDFVDFRKEFDFKSIFKKFKEKNISIIHQENKNFPKNLLNIADPPICIYVKGDYDSFDFDGKIASVVGTRMPTQYGQKTTKDIVYTLVGAGFSIISGLALGIDSIAHSSCLESGGATIAVLGCGVDIVYPSSNKNLYQEILNNNGLIISEFPPGMTVLKGLFVARNRLISALSNAVIVIEGSNRSGSLITARYAADQGKDVYAVPGSISSRMSEAPNLLIKEGAKPIISMEDLIQEFNIGRIKSISKIDKSKLNKFEKKIIEKLKENAKNTDEILEKQGKDLPLILQALTSLEMKGYVVKGDDGKYSIT